MKRAAIVLVCLAGLGASVWALVTATEVSSPRSEQPAAIILRAPNGFTVEALGSASLRSAAAALAAKRGARTGVRFSDRGDEVLLLADRPSDRVVEMRAARNGTIVERFWTQGIDRRLAWAAEHGELSVPGLPRPTGKNLYH
ncbi:MAG: hypothetical protein LJE95_12590 [Acidobacteria bacterium]|nr:hypothetical protein [Acidobacteriota bacterium]